MDKTALAILAVLSSSIALANNSRAVSAKPPSALSPRALVGRDPWKTNIAWSFAEIGGDEISQYFIYADWFESVVARSKRQL